MPPPSVYATGRQPGCMARTTLCADAGVAASGGDARGVVAAAVDVVA